MNAMDSPGKGILKFVSILYIVCGSVFALLMVISLIFGSVIASLVGGMISGMGGAGLLTGIVGAALFVVFLIPAAIDLVVGILGVKFAGDPAKSTFFIVWGFILSIFALIMVAWTPVLGIIALIMPVLLIVGGFMSKRTTPIVLIPHVCVILSLFVITYVILNEFNPVFFSKDFFKVTLIVYAIATLLTSGILIAINRRS